MFTKNGKNEGIGIVSLVIVVILAILLIYYFFSPHTHNNANVGEQIELPLEVPASVSGR